MKFFIAPAWLRAFLLFGGAALWLGIWHTGFSVASFILYIPAVLFVFAGATGICPGVMMTRALFPPKDGASS